MIIVIEGGDQAGKLTQSTMLEKALKKRKIKNQIISFSRLQNPYWKRDSEIS